MIVLRAAVLPAVITCCVLATIVRPPLAAAPPAQTSFHCALDATCPEINVIGDPPAMLSGNPAPFRGYGDPSLERDPATGALWMSYSWLDVLVTSPGPPPVIDLGVRTHLARSDDGGATFTFERAVNATTAQPHPDTSVNGWTIHEVSTLLREPAGSWQLLWLTYFDPFGEPAGPEDRSDFYYRRSLAAAPPLLGDTNAALARGNGTSASFGAQYNLSLIPQLSDCVAFTEPALFAHGGVTYLATNCVVFSGGVRQDAQERLVLLRQEADGYSYVGALLDGADAVDLGGTRFEQADIAYSMSGRILLIGTPIQNATPEHLGCVVLEITDIAAAQVKRDAGGDAMMLSQITGEDPGIGPGLCTYDPDSSTGVIMVLHIQQSDPFDLEFSMRATGVHPDVASVGGDVRELPAGEPAADSRSDGEATPLILILAAALIALLVGADVFCRRRPVISR